MLKISDLTFKREENVIFENINIEFKKGEIYALIGKNGAGKSSFIKCISGIWPFENGAVEYNGKTLPEDHLNFKEITGFLQEHPFFYDLMTGMEFLNFVCGLRKIDIDKEKLDRFTELFCIREHINKPVTDLSKGVKQKIAIIGTLLHNPEIIILDEPVNGLDPLGVKILREILLAEKKKGKIIILSTHILEIAEKIADELVIINDKKIIAKGIPENLRKESKSELEDLFLELTGGNEYKQLLSLVEGA